MFAQHSSPLPARFRIERAQLLDRKSLRQTLQRTRMTQHLKRPVPDLFGKVIDPLVKFSTRQALHREVAPQLGVNCDLAVTKLKASYRRWRGSRLRFGLLLQGFRN